jgi:restriction system protein
MPFPRAPVVLTPAQYELAVKAILDATGPELKGYESFHLHEVQGLDGDYVIDIVVKFEALGADFTVLVECKHERRPTERQAVQLLKDKLVSTGSQKGILFSVAGFQEGAINYADAHGIALVHLVDGASSWVTKGAGPPTPPPRWVELPEHVGWWCHGNLRSVLSPDYNVYTRQVLGLPNSEA